MQWAVVGDFSEDARPTSRFVKLRGTVI